MKFKTFSKSAVLLTASLAVLAACGSKNTASSPDYKLEGVTFPLQENIEVYDSQFTVIS
ncbi:ABC transporter substrate-binding protein [Streptococcus pneumoniae]|nr:ABC transporter substrate-binding protein [Streptococcus pneumoniae]